MLFPFTVELIYFYAKVVGDKRAEVTISLDLFSSQCNKARYMYVYIAWRHDAANGCCVQSYLISALQNPRIRTCLKCSWKSCSDSIPLRNKGWKLVRRRAGMSPLGRFQAPYTYICSGKSCHLLVINTYQICSSYFYWLGPLACSH
jgi:hypothetical protein